MKLVLIEWLDAYGGDDGWEHLDGPEPEELVCRSVGWLVCDGQKTKTVVPHLTARDHPHAEYQGCGHMIIPTAAVRRIVDLEERS